MKTKKKIIKVIKYFSIFDYYPDFKEIHTFLSEEIAKKELEKNLKHLDSSKIIRKLKIERGKSNKYTLGEYSIKQEKELKLKAKRCQRKYYLSQKKLSSLALKVYLRILAFFPQIRFVGLSGSLAMMNGKKDDDFDLFIITAGNRLWTGRFIALFIAILLIKKRRRGVKKAKNKFCLNLFFEEKHLVIPNFKRSLYLAHEVVQLKPLLVKNNIYRRFIKANKWVFDFFPNWKPNLKLKNSNLSYRSKFGNWFEILLKNVQLLFINRHKTSEIITDGQLWFFPDDFGKKIAKLFQE